MILSEKEMAAIKDLQTQEKTCVEKYARYSKEAKDPVLANLFEQIHREEQKHYDSLGQVLNGTVPPCDCNDSDGKQYSPKATYDMKESEDKKNDCFLATVSVQRSWSLLNTIWTCSSAVNHQSVNYLLISRLKNRIMQKCSINIRL